MEQEFLKAKAALRDRAKYGDLAEAARQLGVKLPGMSEWLKAEKQWHSVDARNYKALKTAIEAREEKLRAVIAA